MLFKWQQGRQQTGYFKMLLAKGKSWDCWLLKYEAGAFIPLHKDVIEGKEHYRLNICLKRADYGGKFYIPMYGFSEDDHDFCRKGISTRRWHLFRPDLVEHGVTRVVEGTRYILSIGWTKET